MSKKNIIICVDDEQMVLESLREQLSREFKDEFQVEIIDSAEGALELIDECMSSGLEVALVISDQIMPGMKGDELLTRIHRKSPKTLKILLTGQASTEVIGHAINSANLYRYIPKPWNHRDLHLSVKEAVRHFTTDKTMEEKVNELELKNKKLSFFIDTLNQFVPNQFLQILNIASDDYIRLGICAPRFITVLFSDIRSFTSVSEGKSPLETFRFINEHYAQMSPIITQHNGFIDTYIGDAIMAIFLDPDKALMAAIEMQRAMQGKSYAIDIGINSGEVIMGTVGEPNRLQTTILGNTVNIAQLMESLNKIYKTGIIITGTTFNRLQDRSNYSIRKIDTVNLTDEDFPTIPHEVFDFLPEDIKAKKLAISPLFEQAQELYFSKEFAMAQQLFSQCQKNCPDDAVIQLYLERIENHNN
jgi:class 3 adenylate cyclase/FixJ family two-component response regulator